jgi:hypothetical protein
VPAPFDDDGFADFSDDDDDDAVPAGASVPPVSKVSALLKKGVTIAPPTSTPVGSDALARPSVFEVSKPNAPEPSSSTERSAATTEPEEPGARFEPEPLSDAPASAPTDAAFETTFDEDGFADFESDEDTPNEEHENPENVAEKDDATEIATNEDESSETRAASVSAATSSEVLDSSVSSPLSFADRAQFDGMFDAYTADNPPGVTGLSGAQLVQITANAGLATADLSLMWQLVAAPGADALRRDDFVLFCHLLRLRVAGAPLPRAVDAEARSLFFSESGGETKEEMPTTDATTKPSSTMTDSSAASSADDAPVAVVVESVRGVKDASKMQNVSATLRLVSASGEPIESARSTPMGAATVRAGGVVVFETPVQFSTTYGSLPPGASLLLELKHFKKPKMSVKCWAAFDKRAVARGARAETKKLAKPVKPDAASIAKAKPWMKSGDGDVTVRFQ